MCHSAHGLEGASHDDFLPQACRAVDLCLDRGDDQFGHFTFFKIRSGLQDWVIRPFTLFTGSESEVD